VYGDYILDGQAMNRKICDSPTMPNIDNQSVYSEINPVDKFKTSLEKMFPDMNDEQLQVMA